MTHGDIRRPAFEVPIPVRRPDRYHPARTLVAVAALASLPTHAQITFYEPDNFRGRAFITSQPISEVNPRGFSDRGSSVIVHGGRWQVCQDIALAAKCVVLRPGTDQVQRSVAPGATISVNADGEPRF